MGVLDFRLVTTFRQPRPDQVAEERDIHLWDVDCSTTSSLQSVGQGSRPQTKQLMSAKLLLADPVHTDQIRHSPVPPYPGQSLLPLLAPVEPAPLVPAYRASAGRHRPG